MWICGRQQPAFINGPLMSTNIERIKIVYMAGSSMIADEWCAIEMHSILLKKTHHSKLAIHIGSFSHQLIPRPIDIHAYLRRGASRIEEAEMSGSVLSPTGTYVEIQNGQSFFPQTSSVWELSGWPHILYIIIQSIQNQQVQPPEILYVWPGLFLPRELL